MSDRQAEISIIRLKLAVSKLPTSQREAVTKLIIDHSALVERIIAEYDRKVSALKDKLMLDIMEAISRVDDKGDFLDSYFAFWNTVGL